MKLLNKYIPEYARIPLIFVVILQILSYSVTKLIAAGFYHHNFETAWDLATPFLSWTFLIYVASYAFWVVNVILSVRFDEARAYRFLCADAMGKLISLVIFLVLPTTNTRPELGTGFWDTCMRLIYTVDTPDNLFPSMHCLMSWLCFLGVLGEKRIPRWYQVFSLLFCFAIFASTLTTKQHIFIDVLGGWLLADLCYRLSAWKPLPRLYCKAFGRTLPETP